MTRYTLNHTRLAAYAALVILLMPGVRLCAQDEYHLDFGVAFLHGAVHGRVQTPLGRDPATTSRHRPSLEELGIEDTGSGDFWANVSRGPHGLYLGGRLLHLAGDSTLDTTLVSQGITFPAGSPVDAHAKFDWYRLGYRHLFSYDWAGRTIEFYPAVGMAILDYRYTLSSPGIRGVDRGYTKPGGQAGLGVIYPFSENFTLTVQVLAPAPIPDWPQITSAQAVVRYRFLDRNDISICGLFGIDYDWISYNDRHDVANDIKVDIGPMGLVGLEVSF